MPPLGSEGAGGRGCSTRGRGSGGGRSGGGGGGHGSRDRSGSGSGAGCTTSRSLCGAHRRSGRSRGGRTSGTRSDLDVQASALDVHTGEVPVFLTLVVFSTRAVGKTQDTQVPVGRVGGGAGRGLRADASEISGTLGVPEADGVGGEVDLVGKVMPNIWGPVNVPLGLTTDEPAEVVVGRGSGVAVDPAVLEFSEVRLAVHG